jgi:hypothetical protein
VKAPPPVICDDQFREGPSVSVFLEIVPAKLPLVVARHRHLKWKALDPLERVLMVICGISIIGFTSSVFLDVLTRQLHYPFLWLQLVTTGFFGWGIFIGMATATRRIDHLNLVEITKRLSGPKRTFIETFNRLVILVVGFRSRWSRRRQPSAGCSHICAGQTLSRAGSKLWPATTAASSCCC